MTRREASTLSLMVVPIAAIMSAPALGANDLSLNVSPSTECVSTGETITVRLNVANLGGVAINGVQVRLNYDNTLMTLVDIVPESVVGDPAEGWVEVSQSDTNGDVDWSAVINGGSIAAAHTVATMTFTAIADGTASVTFRPDNPPFVTKLTKASDNTTITPTTHDTSADFNGDGVGNAFIGPPDCTITAASAVCDGSSGNIASVPDAGAGATYAWAVTGGTLNSGQNTTSISYTAGPGPNVTIDITVTDANGCTSSCQKIVTVNANPDCTITAADSVCATSTGNPASVPDAGAGSTYAWSIAGGTIDSGQGTTSIAFSAGSGPSVTLDVTVTDGNGCTSSCQKVISVAAPDCTITAANEVCDGSTGNTASVPDAGLGATYTWTVTDGTITGGQGTTAITYTAGSGTALTIEVTVVSGASCQSTCQKVVTVNPNPDCTITAANAVCDGTSGHAASVPDAGAGATYAWSVSGGTLDSGQGTTSITYTAGSGPNVTIDITVTDANNCTSTCQKVVTVNANPDCTITAENAICASTSGHAASVPDAGAGATYAWTVTGGTLDSGQGTTSISYTAGAGPTLTIDITVTDANGCTSSCQHVVTVNTNPDCTITAADAVCDGSTGNTASVPDAGAGATYAWTVTGGTLDSGQGTTSISYTAGAGPSLTIDITVTDANGCTSSCQKVVSVASNPSCVITADSAVCDGSTGNVASTADVGAGATYDWTVTGGTLTSGQDTPSITYTAGSGTSLTIDLTVTDSGGCVSTCQTVVTINANPECTITADAAVCAGTSAHSASVPDAGAGSTYVWSITGGTIDSGQGTTSISYTAGAGPTLTIDITVTDGNSCTSSCQTVVTVNPNPDCTITAADAVCDGSGGNGASVPDAGAGASYSWTVTGGTLDNGQGTTSINYTAGSGPSVTLDVTVTDSNGCVSTCQKVVTVDANPDCTITAADAVCDGSSGNTASVPVAVGPVTYAWTVTGGTIDSGQNSTTISYTAGAGPTLTVDVTITDGNGCVSTCQKVVSVNPNPVCTITADAAVCAGTSGHAASVPDAGAGATYAWSVTGGTLDSGQGTTSISYTAGFGATVTLDVTVTDANGCVSSCQTVVTVNASPDCTITAPSLVCEGSTSNLASAPTGAVDYVWAISGGTIDSGQGTDTISFSAGSAGTLTLDVTVTDVNGCVSSCQELITVDAPNCTISSADSVCFQSTGNLATAPSGAASYIWTIAGGTITSQTDNAITYTAGSGTNVTLGVTVTNANGCSRTCQKVVTIIQPSLDVTLELEGITNTVTRNVTFTITECGGSVDTRTVPVTTDSFGVGSVIVDNVSSTADWVAVQEGHTLRRLAGVVFDSCFVATIDLTTVGSGSPLLTGDLQTGGVVGQDNLVDVTDFSILASRWNQMIDANLSTGADVTGDGLQAMADFTTMQVNFFTVGEAADGCAALVVSDDDGLTPIVDVMPVPLVPVERKPQISASVQELAFPGAELADMNGDGYVDAADIRLFARWNRLPLLPEFERKLDKLEMRKLRPDRGR